MDNGVDRYLHKKFKKQLTIETSRINAINNKSNNESVPTTYSTNRSESSSVCVKSSISDILVNSEIVSSTDCVKYGEAEDISYVKVSVNQETSLVTTTSSTSTNHVVEKKEGGGKHVCPYCNLACSKPSVLQKHIRAHTNERPYPCVSCGFSFKTRSNLYKHCRSRTHANRVMGNKAQEITSEIEGGDSQSKESTLEVQEPPQPQEIKAKPYKPRFHTKYDNSENAENESKQDLISLHINELIDKNNSIVNTSEPYLAKRRSSMTESVEEVFDVKDEPLNLTKNRKRCLSEVSEQITQKSLIKELLLKNLYADTNMQCPHCKMIFQTVTELELHKMRSCKGFTKSGARYSRSSSVNVASILTQNKNAFDNIPQLQNAVFPLKSPGPFLGKTRLVESDKTKSFSFEDGIQFAPNAQRFSMSPLTLSYERVKKPPVKLFGGEVKITQTSGETKSYKIDGKDREKYNQETHVEYTGRLSENRVVKSTLGSGGTVLQSKPSYNQETLRTSPDVIRVFENTSVSPNIDIPEQQQQHKYHHQEQERVKENGNLMNDTGHVTNVAYTKYTNIMDFSQNAAKMLAPNLKQLNLTIPGLPMPTKFIEAATTAAPLLAPAAPATCPPAAAATAANHYPSEMNSSLKIDAHKRSKLTPDAKLEIDKFPQKSPIILSDPPLQNGNVNPMNLLINGKVVRYVPGMPGPAAPIEQSVIQKPPRLIKPNIMITPVEPPLKPEPEKLEPIKTEIVSPESTPRKFARPNSLALKPSMTSLKQHHGLTPTMFNQILISPDTPRGAKKYNEHFLHGNYFSYLGLKSSTKPVYCTLNKTQPFYVPHFKKLSMYSEWRQQDHKSDKLYVSAYDSMQRSRKYTIAGKYDADYIAHSSYKFTASEVPITKEESQKSTSILGGYESNEDYTYIRGRGRGRYVCDQCGIRCKKPSMLKKHIRTHSNDRPYTCQHCNFSFKTKGNLTKHMKSKAHTKNYAASGSSSSSAQQSGTQSSDSDTEDSGMDSSDESSTRQQEHEAAYGLLSLSQKTASTMQGTDVASPSSATLSLSPISTISNTDSSVITSASFINAEQLVHVSKTNYAKNKILDQKLGVFSTSKLCSAVTNTVSTEDNRMSTYLGSGSFKTLMYPYTTPNLEVCSDKEEVKVKEVEKPIERKNIIHFNVIKRYNSGQTNVIYRKNEGDDYKEADKQEESSFRKRKISSDSPVSYKIPKNDEVIDLSMPQVHEKPHNGVIAENERLKTYLDNIEERVKSKNLYNQLQNDENYRTQLQQRLVAYRNDGGLQENNRINVSYIIQESPVITDVANTSSKTIDYDNSAMETLADIATKQEKLEKNSVARNVATEFLKLATKNEYPNGEEKSYGNVGKDMNDLVGKSEENKSCTICLKNFSKPSQLRLHMNIHYLERPFRCESCSVSFRTKGHLQKHERSASHHNKLSSSPALSSSEPRPFKCSDCNVAFRIHGHLAKHLRSKMHIMKLECLAKIPFGLYAELERSNILLTEINTADGDQCLDSLKMLAKKVFINDPSKLNQLEERSDRIEHEGDS